jgi:hypothetical protein
MEHEILMLIECERRTQKFSWCCTVVEWIMSIKEKVSGQSLIYVIGTGKNHEIDYQIDCLLKISWTLNDIIVIAAVWLFIISNGRNFYKLRAITLIWLSASTQKSKSEKSNCAPQKRRNSVDNWRNSPCHPQLTPQEQVYCCQNKINEWIDFAVELKFDRVPDFPSMI